MIPATGGSTTIAVRWVIAAGCPCCDVREDGAAGCCEGARFSGAAQHEDEMGLLQHSQRWLLACKPQSPAGIHAAKPKLIATAMSTRTALAAADCIRCISVTQDGKMFKGFVAAAKIRRLNSGFRGQTARRMLRAVFRVSGPLTSSGSHSTSRSRKKILRLPEWKPRCAPQHPRPP